MAWKFDNERSIYMQLVEQIQNRILVGIYPPGSKMASVRELAGEAEVNPNTMQRAFMALEDMGLVRTMRTSGRFVTEDQRMIENLKKQSALEIINDFKKKMQALGYTEDEMISLMKEEKKES